jgi:two-component system cell cycle sensor histidine kinase/response regulator CckA
MVDHSDAAPPNLPSDGGAVLVVDDDPLVRSLVARAIAEAGYSVLVAGDGEEALALARTLDGQLGLVVTDIRMPVMDGPTLAALLAALHPRLPIMFISGYTTPANAANLSGPVLAKPFGPDDLMALVHRMLGAPGGAPLST